MRLVDADMENPDDAGCRQLRFVVNGNLFSIGLDGDGFRRGEVLSIVVKPDGSTLVGTAPWMPSVEEWDVSAFDLPSLCLSLRMACNGAGDPWSPEKVALARAHIESKLATWRLPESAFDEAVRLMCEATMKETA